LSAGIETSAPLEPPALNAVIKVGVLPPKVNVDPAGNVGLLENSRMYVTSIAWARELPSHWKLCEPSICSLDPGSWSVGAGSGVAVPRAFCREERK
jgi:hypothetical protein